MSMKIAPILLIAVLALSSCVTHEELVNFNKGPEFSTRPDSIGALPVLRIQPDDALFITVHTLEPTDAAPFNIAPGQTANAESGANAANYLVDGQGQIEMPVIGSVVVGGLSVAEARDSIRQRLLPYLKAPIVNIRFTQFRFTVLGEVKNPTTFTLAEEKISILEALGMAGDLTTYANRNNILVIREENGLRSFGRIDVQARDVFRSPYFYLRPNDVIYIEPTKDKTGSVTDQFSKALPWIGAGTAFLNLVLILATR